MQVMFNRRKQGKVVQVIECEATNVAWANDGLAIIELHGVPTAVRAVWAHLMKHRMGSSSDQADPTDVYVAYMGDWKQVQLAAKEKYLHKTFMKAELVYRRGFERTSRDFIVGGTLTSASPYFLEAFRLKFTSIPVLPEWSEVLWAKGVEAKVVTPLESASESGTCFWKLGSGVEGAWASIVKEVVTNGKA